MSKGWLRGATRFLGRLVVSLTFLTFSLIVYASGLEAADYPTKTVQLVCPWSAGGSTDIVARNMARHLAERWKVSVIVVNKTGGQGIPGTLEVLKASPDGYTILVESNASSSLLDAWGSVVPFDFKERTYLANATALSFLFWVRADSPWKTMDDIAEAIRKDPSKIKWGWGGGTFGLDVVVAKFLAALTAKGADPSQVKKINLITYKGGADIGTAMAGGHVDIGCLSASATISLAAAGKVRPIAAAGPRRDIFLKDVPTTAEQGWPSVSSIYWVGFSGPKGLPSNVVHRWVTTVQGVLKDPKIQNEFGKLGMHTEFMGGDDFRRFVINEAKEIKSLPAGGVK